MASNSKSTNLGGASSYIQRCTLTAYFNETGTSTTNNTSTVYCKASLYTPSASWDNGSGRDDHLRIYWHDNRENYDRLVATWSGSSVWCPTTITAEGTIDVTHKDDGTLSGYAWATWSRDGGNTSYAPASGGVSTDWTNLTTIARASQPSINTYPNNSPDFNIGDTITIHMNRKSNQFTHTVKINYGNTTQTIATGVTDNCTFDTSTIANDLYALIPDANTYSGTISVTTYNGSTNIGTKTCAYNANVANSNPTWAHFNDWIAYTKNAQVRSALANSNVNFLQGMSVVEFRGTKQNAPEALNGASLASITVSIADALGTLTWDASLPSSIAFDIGNPTQAGMMTLNAIVTDSRGNTSTFQRDVYVIPYQAPGIAASCERRANFEADTTIKISGTMASVKFGIGDTTTERNSINPANGVAYRYKQSTSQTWGSWTNVASSTSASGAVTTSPFTLTLDNQQEWEFEFRITDFFNSQTLIARHVGQGQPQFFIGADGRTSVGGVPQIQKPSGNLGQLEVNGNAYANGNRLAELPITNADLSTGCVHAENIDLATLCPGINKIVQTTFVLNDYIANMQPRIVTLKSNAGTTIKLAIDNAGTIFRIVEGGKRVIRADQSWGYKTSPSPNAYIGVIGLKNAPYWVRATGIENGWSYTNTEQAFSPEAQSSQGGYYGLLKTGNSGSGARAGAMASFTCVRSSGTLQTQAYTDYWSIMGKVNVDGNLSYCDFNCQCQGMADGVPSIYQKGISYSGYTGHASSLLTIYEVVE